MPILIERAREKSEEALQGIAGMATPEATEALLRLADHDDASFALAAAQALVNRLPLSRGTARLADQITELDASLTSRRQFGERAWEPRFAAGAVKLGRRFLEAEDADRLECGAAILAALGDEQDLPYFLRALDRQIEATTLPRKKDQYPQPREVCRRLLLSAGDLGLDVPDDPAESETLGQAVIFLNAGRRTDRERLASPESRYARLLRHRVPFVREVALENFPLSGPPRLLELLSALFADHDENVQIAACQLAERLRTIELKKPVFETVATTRDKNVFRSASSAALAVAGRLEALEAVVLRLAEKEMTGPCLSFLAPNVVEIERGWSGPSDDWTDATAQTCQARWLQFLEENGEALKAGKRFHLDDPEITADLFPTVTFHKD